MNQPEPNDAQDMSSIDLEGLIFGSDYLDDPNFLALPIEVREAWIDADKNGQLFSVEDEKFPHHSVQKQRDLDRQQWNSFNKELEDRTEEYNNSCRREEDFMNELFKTQVEKNRRVLEDLALGELIQSEFENLVNSSLSDSKDENISIISIKISLKLDKTHDANNKPLGTQSFHVPHIDETKLDPLKGFYLIYGDIQCTYKFDSGREIKVYVKDKYEGIRVINQLLKVVRSEHRKGNAQKHCEFKEVKKNKKPETKGSLTYLHIIDSTGRNERYEFKNRDKPPNL